MCASFLACLIDFDSIPVIQDSNINTADFNWWVVERINRHLYPVVQDAAQPKDAILLALR